MYFAPAGLVVVAPLPNGNFRIVATVDDAPPQPDASTIQTLLDSRGPRGGSGTVSHVAWSSRFRLQHRVADHYRSGPYFLVGDAAHVHSPAGGQGMNTGMVDAVVLGRILADVLSGRRDERHLDAYETLRRPAAKAVLKLAGGLTRMATMRSRSRRFLRNLELRAVNRLPLVRRRFAMNLSGLSRRRAAQVP